MVSTEFNFYAYLVVRSVFPDYLKVSEAIGVL